MRGLTIIVADASPARLRSALTLGCAQAALGGRARLFLDVDAVALVRQPIECAGDAAHVAAGLPPLGALHDTALDLGVAIIACQSGMALIGVGAADFDPRMQSGGMVDLLQSLGDDRLIGI